MHFDEWRYLLVSSLTFLFLNKSNKDMKVQVINTNPT